MQFILIFVCLFSSAICFNPAYKEHVEKAVAECQKNPATSASEEWIKNPSVDKAPAEGKFLLCFLKQVGSMNEQGKLVKSGMEKDLMLAFNDKKKVDDILKQCYSDKSESSPEETAIKNYVCVVTHQ